LLSKWKFAALTKINAKRAFRLASEKGLAYREQWLLLREIKYPLSPAPAA
jgi:hypothetical protein